MPVARRLWRSKGMAVVAWLASLRPSSLPHFF
jgi:hypothetical protein